MDSYFPLKASVFGWSIQGNFNDSPAKIHGNRHWLVAEGGYELCGTPKGTASKYLIQAYHYPPPYHLKLPLAGEVQMQYRIISAGALPSPSYLIVFVPVTSLLWNLWTASGLAHDDAVHGKYRNGGFCA